MAALAANALTGLVSSSWPTLPGFKPLVESNTARGDGQTRLLSGQAFIVLCSQNIHKVMHNVHADLRAGHHPWDTCQTSKAKEHVARGSWVAV